MALIALLGSNTITGVGVSSYHSYSDDKKQCLEFIEQAVKDERQDCRLDQLEKD